MNWILEILRTQMAVDEAARRRPPTLPTLLVLLIMALVWILVLWAS